MKSILETDFVVVTIDESDMLNGEELSAKLKNHEPLGLPWFVFTDAQKNVLANATGPNGNVGCPMMPEERKHFISCIEKSRINISDQQLDELSLLLHEYAFEVLGPEVGMLPTNEQVPVDASA
ncbi:MAG: hypothetical protein QGF46_02305, partial [Planctomycetota bacterium]|nr:hypothetical protein [Planctomycetota bacterium]